IKFILDKKQPLKVHENILVFYKKQPNYNPQIEKGKPYVSGKGDSGEVTNKVKKIQTKNKGTRYPKTVQKIKREFGLHPTQKPVALFEYLIKTYTNESETVLDNCMGSGTTAIACINTNRNYIGLELDEEYYKKSIERINNHIKDKQIDLFEMLDN